MRKSTWKETKEYWKLLHEHKIYHQRIKNELQAIKYALRYKNLNHATDPSELPFR